MGRDLAQRAQQSVAQQGKSGDDLQANIQKMEQAFQLAMPKGVEAKQLIRDALTCLQVNPKLAECDQKSVLGSLMTCAQLGLRPGVGALGQAYLLPFWDSKTRGQKAQLVIGYQGYVELAHRSGRIASIHARTVYENDYFEVEYGAAEDKWVHRPCIDGP
ncbi:recombinase RecT, partial [Mycolicibacterium fortuitum]|uniref:recombinase RecT n=1 Tax=Mycolicibacterium fortuitum TaxID=1766 RepID=UPI00157E01A4